MSSEDGMVVFRRGDTDDNDIWDDTALIKAYDDAVSIMKSELAQKNGDSPELEADKTSASGKKHKKRRKHKSKKDKNQQQHQARWNVGDHCRSVYTEDGQVYEATIKSINQEKQSCVLHYLGYGNEEEQLLNDLLPSSVYAGHRSRQNTQTQLETESMDWMSPGGNHPARTTPVPLQRRGTPQQPLFSMPPAVPPFPSGLPPFPAMPPMFPSMSVGMPMAWPGFGTTASPRLPEIPPPPPPINDGLLEGDNEALCSMLMAWYMSGYHTGYYQGLKAGKKVESTSTGVTQTTKTASAKEETTVVDGSTIK